MAGTMEALRQVTYFADLPAGALRDLAGQVRQRSYRTGEMVVLEGEKCDGLYFVIRGRVRVFKVSAKGREQVLRILGPRRTFNDVPVFDGGPNPASIAALEPTTVGLIPKGAIHALIDAHPVVAKAVIRLLASRLRAHTLMIEDLALRGVAARVAKLLLDCSRGQAVPIEGATGPCVRITQQDIAAMTGSVRVVVQRALKALESDSAIRLQRARIQVVDAGALARWAESPALRSP